MVSFALINAEALGVDSGNVDEMVNSDNIAIRRLLGTEGEFGQADLGLDADFVVDVISAVGNYGEIYDRYMGPEGLSFTLPRAQNDLWTNGGLIYAPPMK
jgi:general L-amino acid transport system substrate-binding protein